MKRNGLMAATLLLTLAPVIFTSCIKTKLRMATGGYTQTYYAFGSALARVLSETTNISIIIQSTGASKANIQLIDAGEVELAIVQNDVMDYAWRGVDLFTNEQITSFASIAALYTEVCQIVANPVSGIRSIADLKGKNISVGDVGSGVEFNARQILEAYGITFDDIGKQNLSFGASADALRDNKIDAFFCVAGAPTSAIIDLATGKNIIFLEIDEEHAARLISDYPFYTRVPIPGGSYRGQTNDVMTVAVKATLIAGAKVSDNTVYSLTKALFENKTKIGSAHVKGKELAAVYALEGISVPFHQGAVKYYTEIGALP